MLVVSEALGHVWQHAHSVTWLHVPYGVYNLRLVQRWRVWQAIIICCKLF